MKKLEIKKIVRKSCGIILSLFPDELFPQHNQKGENVCGTAASISAFLAF